MKRQNIQKVVHVMEQVQGSQGQGRLGRDFYSQSSIDLAKALLGKVLVRYLPTRKILRGTIVETEAYPGTEEASSLNAHCFITKQTDKNAGIFMEAGTTWVYLTYGVFNMINISALRSACLLRAIEPKGGQDEDLQLMEYFRLLKKPKKNPPSTHTADSVPERATRSRGRESSTTEVPPIVAATENPEAGNKNEAEVPGSTVKQKSKFKTHELGNGPGKLCKALNIEKSTCDQLDLTSSPLLWIEENEEAKYRDRSFEIIEAKRIGIDSAPEASRNDLLRFYISDNFCVSTAKPSLIKKKLAETAVAESAADTESPQHQS